jgi:HEAT repeat protein
VPAVIERLVKQLYITAKAVRLYPTASNIPKERAAALLAVLRTAQQRIPDVTLYFARDGVYFGDDKVFPELDAYVQFAREFYSRNVDQVRFHVGLTSEQALTFLGLLLSPPDDLQGAGGFEQRLWDLSVANITVKEIVARVVDADLSVLTEEAEPEEPWPPTAEEIDEAVAAVVTHRPGAHRILMRVMLDDEAVAEYLRDSLVSRGATPPDALVAGRIGALAHVLAAEPPEERIQLLRSLAEAFNRLPAADRRAVLVDRLLPAARHDSAIAAVVEAMTVAELTEIVATSVLDSPGAATRESARAGMTRAMHNLLMIGGHDRKQLESAMTDALTAAGADPDYIGCVLAEAMPSRVAVPETRRAADPSVATAVQVVELASRRAPIDAAEDDLEMQALHAEALSGIDDAAVLGTLVLVATRERREGAFDSAVAVLEDSFHMLLQSQNFTTAADAADALAEAAHDELRPVAQRGRLSRLLETLTDRESIAQVASAVRRYPAGSPEQAACRRLLERLGIESMDNVLAALAEEQDMVTRKALVDALADVAPHFTEQLSRRVSDPRWYVVRNVVILLGRTRDPAAVTALSRAMRYPEPRVRREAIRALDAIPDTRAPGLVVTALADDDAGNVGLAARLLGAHRLEAAVPALEEVAAGEGRGNRGVGPRVEAIEALGRIGAPSSEQLLESLVRFRGLRSLGRTREIVPAAERALATMRARRATPPSPTSPTELPPSDGAAEEPRP